jgi:DNA invertase Pin-like site-specific DNA recombinase
MMQMVGTIAEFDRAMQKERTEAGLDAARKEGRIGGRGLKLKPNQQQEIVQLVRGSPEMNREPRVFIPGKRFAIGPRMRAKKSRS